MDNDINTIGYFVDNKESIMNSLATQKEQLAKLIFSCDENEYHQIQTRIKQIENSIRFQKYFI